MLVDVSEAVVARKAIKLVLLLLIIVTLFRIVYTDIDGYVEKRKLNYEP
jgi:hypothetical protein